MAATLIWRVWIRVKWFGLEILKGLQWSAVARRDGARGISLTSRTTPSLECQLHKMHWSNAQLTQILLASINIIIYCSLNRTHVWGYMEPECIDFLSFSFTCRKTSSSVNLCYNRRRESNCRHKTLEAALWKQNREINAITSWSPVVPKDTRLPRRGYFKRRRSRE
jgi:hypothetical protein